MDEKTLLLRAVNLAQESNEAIGCGVVITSNGKIVGEAFNSQKEDNIAVNHAEIKAIVLANEYLKSRKISNGVAYCSCEPCAMCLTALSYAKIEKIIFSKSMKQVFPDDPQSNLDSQIFIKNLNFVPTLIQWVGSLN